LELLVFGCLVGLFGTPAVKAREPELSEISLRQRGWVREHGEVSRLVAVCLPTPEAGSVFAR
jgi:hypothetical protein